jgi:hypothetical protein
MFTLIFRYQAQLQRNLLFLAALADEQPQTKAIRAQVLSLFSDSKFWKPLLCFESFNTISKSG